MQTARGIVAGIVGFLASLLFVFFPVGAVVGLVNVHDLSGTGAMMMAVPAAIIGVLTGHEWASRPPDKKLSGPTQVLLWGVLAVLLLSLVLSLLLDF